MQFRDVIGHRELIRKLLASHKEDRLGHANLFSGGEGSGSLTLALAFAQYLNCENKTGVDSCGVCDSCIKCQKMIHPDVHFVYPVVNNPKKKIEKAVSADYADIWREHVLADPYTSLDSWLAKLDAGNKQGNISVFESAAILKKLNLKTFESPYKIVILWLAECMNIAAANKLLKILEEPPEGTIFFLITEEENSLLATIRSRVQIYRLLPLADEILQNALVEKEQVTADEAHRISIMSGGNYHMAKELSESSDSRNDWQTMFIEWMRMSFSPMRDFGKLLGWIDHIAGRGRNEQKAFLSFCLETARECLLLNYAGDLKRYDYEQFPALEKFAPYINEYNVEDFSKEINMAINAIGRNANAKILFLDLSFRLSRVLKQSEG